MTRKIFFSLIIITILLFGCVGEPTPTETASSIPSLTSIPKPTFTATQPRPIPYPTITPAVPLFPVSSPDWSEFVTTTPITKPDLGVTAYKLADWDAEKAMDHVLLMEQYAYANDIPGLSGNRYMFQSDQHHIKLALQEALIRYPESEYAEELRWKLANVNAVLDDDSSDEWIVNTLEEGLNTGKFRLEDLDIYLANYGFEIDETKKIANLFEDGKEAKIYLINTQHEYTTDGLWIAFREIESDEYDVILMASFWDFAHGLWEIKGVEDLNENGVPEVFATMENIATGSYSCYFYILEWQDDHFAVLTEDNEPIWTGLCNIDYETSDKVIKVAQGTQFSSIGSAIYEWNGYYYELSRKTYKALLDNLSDKFYYQDFAEAEEEIILYMEGRSDVEEFDRWADLEEGTATDFLRFLLGLTYAYRSDVENAREVFLDLAKAPTDPSYPYISQAAYAFVTKYYDDVDIYKACSAALEVLDGLSPELIGIREEMDIGPSLNPYCSNSAVFTLMINMFDPAAKTPLPDILKNVGVTGVMSAKFDLWNNGKTDWLVVANLPGSERIIAFLVVQYDSYWLSMEIDIWLFETPSWVDVYPLDLPGLEAPVILLRAGEDLEIVDALIEGEELTIQYLLSTWGDEYHKVNLDIVPEIFAFNYYKEEYDGVLETGYAFYSDYWDENRLEFVRGLGAEKLIFEEGQYEEAILMLKEDIQLIKRYSLSDPKMLYLLGLAYELSGDSTMAVQTYYQLWSEHPDSPYALLARAKLEPVSP